jgi:alpha,alpha-trehalose-phosphate synthase [UDP-forming]
MDVDPTSRSPELVVVANRLPVESRNGRLVRSPGGLVSALTSAAGPDSAWVGWLGTESTTDHPTPTLDDPGLHAVALSELEVAGYYDGFCNALLWPLFHGRLQPLQLKRSWWKAYRSVNQRFADAAAEIAPANGTVWAHDYHLMLVPGLLRSRRPDLRIGHFLHIPFPPVQLFATLPWRRELLLGLADADLLGLQTDTDVRNLTDAYAEFAPDRHRRCDIGAFPISIDFEFWSQLGDRFTQQGAELRTALAAEFVFLGTDRLDYTKGIAQRLRAFGELLDEGALDATRTVFVQVAAPSRVDVAGYREEREEVEQIVADVNTRHVRPDGSGPIHYIDHQIGQEDVAVCYLAADCLVVTSLADGMNLVAKEYVACQVERGGAVVLSEFAGAANDLPGALVINPYDTEAIKQAMLEVVAMPESGRRQRMSNMRTEVRRHDIDHWAADFLGRLASTGIDADPGTPSAAGDGR